MQSRSIAASRKRGEWLRTARGTLSSWVTTDFERCFQIMDCDDRMLLDEWMSKWSDLVDFEVIPILTAEKASAAIAPHL